MLRVLTSASNVRAGVIQQFHKRGKEDIVELLVLCEEDEVSRFAVIEALRSLANG